MSRQTVAQTTIGWYEALKAIDTMTTNFSADDLMRFTKSDIQSLRECADRIEQALLQNVGG